MTKKLRITVPVRGFLRSTRAVSALEYAILVGVIVVGVVAALNTFSNQVEEALNTVGEQLTDTVDELGGGGTPAPPPANN